MRERVESTPEQFLSGFRAGHENSFTQIFNALYPALCFHALRYTHDQSVAEVIAEDAFIKIWQRKAAFPHFNVLKSYLYQIVRNAAIDWKRQQRLRWAYEKEMAYATPENDKCVLEDLIRAETFKEIYTAIDKLPSECRKIVNMLFIDGKTTRQIAEELDLSLTTVKTQKARGLIAIRRWLPHLLLLLLHGIQLIYTGI